MKIFALLFAFCICLTASGCSKDNPAAPKPVNSSDSMSFDFNASGIQPMRAGEFLALWVKVAPDSSWQFVTTIPAHSGTSDGSIDIKGKFYSQEELDSVKDVLLTLERNSHPSFPGLIISRKGSIVFDSLNKTLTTTLDSKLVFGDYAVLQGSLVFTSTLPDTTAYKHEFYLMDMEGPQQNPSLLSLGALEPGWKYGLWAVDPNFTPHQTFFYGLFSSSKGHDSDSANDHYPYPGGWKPQSMAAGTGSIIVTLEPEFYGDSLKYLGPSPFLLLQFNRIRDILKNKNYPMTNSSSGQIPIVTITVTKG